MMSVTGRDGTPGAPAPGMGDHPTAMSLFGAIMLALYDREKTGRGARVGTSLMASGAWANACNIQARFCNAKFPDRTPGAPPPNPLAAGYLAQDGKAFFIAQLEPDREFPRLCKALGIEEIASSELFCDNAARSANAAELYGLLQSQFESHDLAELRRLFKDADVKWSPMPVLEDVIADPQLAAAGAVTSFSDHAELRTISSPVFVAGSEKRPFAMAPDVGAHTREVLRELGYTDAAIESMIKAGDAADRAR
jgi:formyl-CoA transferase